MRLPRPHLPKFSLADVLHLTAAVAVALAVVTNKEAPLDLGVFLGNSGERMGLLLFAALLLAISLARQSWQLGRALPSIPAEGRAHAKLTIFTQVAIAAAVIASALVVLLANRELVEAEVLVERDWQGASLWKSTIPLILALVVARALADPPREPRVRAKWLRVLRQMVLPGVAIVYGMTVVCHVQLIPALIHVATEGVELAYPARWHRPGTFPNHMLEGYFTTRMAISAAVLWLMGTASLWGGSRLKPGMRRLGLLAIALLSSGGVAAFNWWYSAIEFPRVSPDLASAPGVLTPWGIAGYALACLGISHAWGLTAARRSAVARQTAAEPTLLAIIPLRRGWLVILGGLLVAVYSLWSIVDVLVVFDSIASILQGFSLSDFSGVFAYMFWAPEEFLKLLLIPFGLALAWQAFRRRERPLELVSVRYRDYAVHLVVALLLLAVGIPCLRTLGFTMWLGPDWGHF